MYTYLLVAILLCASPLYTSGYGGTDEVNLMGKSSFNLNAETVVHIHIEECTPVEVTVDPEGNPSCNAGRIESSQKYCCEPLPGGLHKIAVFYPKVDQFSILWVKGSYNKFQGKTARFWVELGCGDCVDDKGRITNTTLGVHTLYQMKHKTFGQVFAPYAAVVVDVGDPSACVSLSNCGKPRFIAFDESLGCSCAMCVNSVCMKNDFSAAKTVPFGIDSKGDLMVHLAWAGRDDSQVLSSSDNLISNFQKFAFAPILDSVQGIRDMMASAEE